MRVPRALEFPAVIVATAVLTFTGVSALQASVNAPLASLAQQRADKTPAQVSFDTASEVSPHLDFFAVLESEGPPSSLVALPAAVTESAPYEPEALAVTGVDQEPEAGLPADAPSAVQSHVEAMAEAPASAPVVAVAAQAAVANRPSPPPPAAAPSPAPPPPPVHTPVSGMDYVWDQVFGSGSFAKPGAPAGSNNGNPAPGAPASGANKGNGKTGVGQVCPPGQAKKGNC